MENTQLQVTRQESVFSSIQVFEEAQRMVKPMASSQYIPENFRGRIDDCLIAMELSYRMGVSPLTVLQNTFIIHGKPGLSSQFLISIVNASKAFATNIRYKMIGEVGTDSYGCIAWAKDKDGEVLEGPPVTIEMAKAEGWMSKPGSKWKTMPDVMLRYRAATFFTRFYAPEITMGMMTKEEIIDVEEVEQQKKSLFSADTPSDTPPPLPPSKKKTDKAKEKDLTKDVTLFEKKAVADDYAQQDLDNQIGVALSELGSKLSTSQVRALCEKNGVKYEVGLLDNEFLGLKTVLGYAK